MYENIILVTNNKRRVYKTGTKFGRKEREFNI